MLLSKFWVRDRLLTKVTDIMEEAIQTRRLPPGLAAKLFGCLGFLTTGCFGKLGRSGLHSIKEKTILLASRDDTGD